MNQEVAEAYGIIKSALRKAGNPIPENDVWIAAIAFSGDFKLVTSDAHFKLVEGLNLIDP